MAKINKTPRILPIVNRNRENLGSNNNNVAACIKWLRNVKIVWEIHIYVGANVKVQKLGQIEDYDDMINCILMTTPCFQNVWFATT